MENENRFAKCKGIPYGGKTFDTGKGLIYILSNLPVPLQNIIAQYITETVYV